MTIQQVQEMIGELSVAERLEIKRWLTETGLPDNIQAPSASEQDSPEAQKPRPTAGDASSSGNTKPSQIDDSSLATSSHLPKNGTVSQEKQAYLSMHQRLWSEYPEQHVAIYHGQLVDHDKDGIALSRRVYAQYPEDFVLIKKVGPQAERTLHFRSPRFVKEMPDS